MEINLSYRQCLAVISEMTNIEQKLNNQKVELESVMENIKFVVSENYYYQINRSLKKQIELISISIEKLKVLRKSLNKIVTLYKNTEESILSFEDEIDSISNIKSVPINFHLLRGATLDDITKDLEKIVIDDLFKYE